MMDDMRIICDARPILGVYYDDGESGYTVGYEGVTKIIPYEENGEMEAVTWFAIYKGAHLHSRLRAGAMEEIRYDEDAE